MCISPHPFLCRVFRGDRGYLSPLPSSLPQCDLPVVVGVEPARIDGSFNAFIVSYVI